VSGSASRSNEQVFDGRVAVKLYGIIAAEHGTVKVIPPYDERSGDGLQPPDAPLNREGFRAMPQSFRPRRRSPPASHTTSRAPAP